MPPEDRVGLRLGTFVGRLRGVGFSLQDRYSNLAAYVCADEPDFEVDLRVGTNERLSWTRSERLSESADEKARTVSMRVTEWAATFHLAERRVEASLRGAWPLAVDSLLKTAVQVFALELGGAILLHSSAVMRDGRAFVFMGQSGAGKSTAAFLSEEVGATVLGEEITFIGGVGGPERPRVYTLPFVQKSGLRIGPMSFPLEGLYDLEQAGDEMVVGLTGREQIVSVARAATIGIRKRPLMDMALDRCVSLARSVPVRRLRFRESSSFWTAIENDSGRETPWN